MAEQFVIFQRVDAEGTANELARDSNGATSCVKVAKDTDGNTVVSHFLDCPDKPKPKAKKSPAKSATKSKAKAK